MKLLTVHKTLTHSCTVTARNTTCQMNMNTAHVYGHSVNWTYTLGI